MADRTPRPRGRPPGTTRAVPFGLNYSASAGPPSSPVPASPASSTSSSRPRTETKPRRGRPRKDASLSLTPIPTAGSSTSVLPASNGSGMITVGDTQEEWDTRGGKRRYFAKDLQQMMYGFGDEPHSVPETVDLMEDIVIDYVMEMTRKAVAISAKRGRLRTEDLLFLIRKDPKKYSRVRELLYMFEELKRVRRAFSVDERGLAAENK